MKIKKAWRFIKQLLKAEEVILVTYKPENKYWTFQHNGKDEKFEKCFNKVSSTLPDFKQKLDAEEAEQAKANKPKPGRYSRKNIS